MTFFEECASESRKWPFNSDYVQRCSTCELGFSGPKRAPSCWECASYETRADWVNWNIGVRT